MRGCGRDAARDSPRGVDPLSRSPRQWTWESFLSQLRSLRESIAAPRVRLRLPWARRKTLSSTIWDHFVSQPGFREETRDALAELESGDTVRLREIPRER